MSRWTQAICVEDWNKQHPERVVPRPGHPFDGVEDGDLETCAFCGEPTRSGFYVRADPATVPFPRDGSDPD